MTMTIRTITEEEVRAHWVQRLPDTPNRLGKFGTAGLTAAEMKAAYDALPLLIVRHFNELVTLIAEGELSEAIPAAAGRSLAAFFGDVTTGELATYLTADGERTLAALAAELDTHDHDGRYAILDEAGRLVPDQLPSGFGEEALAAEEERQKAEEERRRAEEERKRTLSLLSDAVASLAEQESERDRRESEREARLLVCEETTTRLANGYGSLARLAEEAAHTASNLTAAGIGVTHTTVRAEGAAREIRPPAGVLPWARILRLGGDADGGTSAIRAVVSHGAHLLPYPYPGVARGVNSEAITVRETGDGSLILDGVADRSISIVLYDVSDELALPCEPIYIDPMWETNANLYVRTGTSGVVYKNGSFTPSEEDEYYGHYLVYLHIAKGAEFHNTRITPCITRGTKVRRGVSYRPPVRWELPEEITSLPAYGRWGNYLDFENGYYYQAVDITGTPLPVPQKTKLDDRLVASAWIPAEEDGVIVPKNDKSTAVDTALLFGVRLL